MSDGHWLHFIRLMLPSLQQMIYFIHIYLYIFWYIKQKCGVKIDNISGSTALILSVVGCNAQLTEYLQIVCLIWTGSGCWPTRAYIHCSPEANRRHGPGLMCAAESRNKRTRIPLSLAAIWCSLQQFGCTDAHWLCNWVFPVCKTFTAETCPVAELVAVAFSQFSFKCNTI